MKYVRLWIVSFLICLVSLGQAGELSKPLHDILTTKSANDFVSVWIKLPDKENISQLKAAVYPYAATRQERHARLITRLQADSRDAQRELLTTLRQWENQNLARNIRPHWLINVIEADLLAERLPQIAGRADVEIIDVAPQIVSTHPDKITPAPALSTAIGSNLTLIRADEAWAAGYTGAGRIICSFDSGVDGLHPALYNSWKGHDGDSAAAWFDPQDHESFPHIPYGYSSSHGTATMGIMVGHDDSTGDTTGIALDAKWISAAVLDIPGASLIDAFEWAADPDGDPNTIDDVPDVINHSWGVAGIGCENMFYSLIENTEALGIVNIFAAGNEGPDTSTIRNPANRANDSLDCFAVGNVDASTTPPTVAASSSRGPSDCTPGAIKPNVSAPGTSIRTTLPSSSYGSFGGTSAAAPHVAALVALLRQKNPNATVEEIKQAILTSANDFGYALPDNSYGWGVIDCMAALNALSDVNTEPRFQVYAFDHPPISAGDTVVGTVVLQNIGADAYTVSGSLTGTHPSLSVLQGTAFFSNIKEGDTVRSYDSIKVIVSDTVTVGSILSMDFVISTASSYTDTAKLYFLVEPPTHRLLATHTTGNITFTISNFGTYGCGDDGFFPCGGVGFLYKSFTNDLFEAGLMIGTAINQVSDGVRNIIGEPDGDFAVLPGGNIEIIQPGATADQETVSRFDDSRGENPLGIEVTQHSYAFTSAPYNDFIILEYALYNPNPYPLNGVYIGLYFDWDIVAYTGDAGGWDSQNQIAWIGYHGLTISDYRGVKPLKGTVASAYTADASTLTYFPEGFTEEEKYTTLTDGFSTDTLYANAKLDLLQVLSFGPLNLEAGGTDTVAFAVVAGDSLDDFLAAGAAAQSLFDSVVTDVRENPGTPLPYRYELSQNYPNPFNSGTVIEYSLSAKSKVTLTVYNILGEKVRTLVEQIQAPGHYTVKWDGKNERDQEVSSGMYFYRLKVGERTFSKKMMLLK